MYSACSLKNKFKNPRGKKQHTNGTFVSMMLATVETHLQQRLALYSRSPLLSQNRGRPFLSMNFARRCAGHAVRPLLLPCRNWEST